MFGPGSEFENPEDSATDKIIVEALVLIQQPAGELYSFEVIAQYKFYLLPL